MKSPLTNDIKYFDYNATHPPFAEILETCLADYLSGYYNPSGITRFSLKNQGKIEQTRKYFANLTQGQEKQFVFSATGTEANYLLIQSLRVLFPNLDSVIVSPLEHSSMYAALESYGFSAELIQTDLSGVINLFDLEKKLKENPRPVVCIYAGNETGVIQPAEAISKLTKKYDQLYYSDLMQGFCKTDVPFSIFDGYTFSGHKIGGGMGAALTYLPKPNPNFHLFGGGNQENNHRAGTENTFAIECFKQVAEIQMRDLEKKNKRLSEFQSLIEEKLETLGCEIIAKLSKRLPNTTFLILPIQAVDFFLLGMEEKGILVSTGSSCKSRAREASKSLLYMGYSEEEALRCIRISTGYFTTEDDVKTLLSNMENLILKFQ
ncbi:aminotransferase class V-fold PLP-dependent enzyme [Leptospira sp. 2 VSF19]|uniref:Aminotransferase class V-fold PLP-dependent enzyme n=1 Tax=Leptospira soteropolitanensis TaxID=2950025 RepID=A0AAW5VM01_9LEPT|nr:aminotransferase class V-fold PLP-dependent enzyme [Leptospira soteropolitanensis]MCW7493080.1 aminotransferase class V-fold PLP-dependent enzyme [Leptospira soteropolitanensis]MCW7500851.1 aminotransferase class V-fold PLP-dependent enzyme [Leptospira soteropolitanensis]MCW7522930.1 aminotransferase class V-fold PLP-dependent enzyme [Leptospira soteropolitanensis]MCW7526963.1 aminotransferase class V-fold PLP-dependent enzyme [Leptospira soteropolitanensis]MCW7530648.1 aminotransferase cla